MSGLRWTPEAYAAHQAKKPAQAPRAGKGRLQALGRLKPGQMNRTEARYAEHLEARKQAGEILWYAFEPVTFKIAPDCRLTPDFMVMMADGCLRAVDVKGSKAIVTDDAKVKMKVAASVMPIPFFFVYPIAAKSGGG